MAATVRDFTVGMTPAAAAEGANKTTPFVLVVDDDEALSENVAEILETVGIRTMIARDRRTALALSGEHDFDVALIDVRLPDGDGLSLLEPLRRRSPFIQLVLVTGNATLEGAIAAVRGDAFAYILKPVSPPGLLDTVRRALEQANLYRERERLRVDLERSEARHREVVESVPAFVLSLDAHGLITTWNRQLERVTGYLRGEMLGHDGSSLVGPDERPYSLPLKAGGARKVRWNRAEVIGSDGAPMVYAIGVDVTDEEEMLRRVLRSERLAAVGTMAAGLAHEVRNPLNSASLQLTVLERRLDKGEGPASIKPIAHIIKSEIERLDRLVRDFLAFAKPSPLDPQPVDVPALLKAVVALIEPEVHAAHVAVAIQLADKTPLPPVAGDAERLRQVLLNLTRNAVEAMQESGDHLTLRARRVGSMVEIDVEDDGPGFAENLPVFDAFFTTKDQGTGLGLSLVHRIVSDHGGSIRVESRPGRTCFTVALPITDG
ncbi:MAG TPA: ATP-binding protein [Polyangia bacterium]|nr:ATP-binding protein [Polyangia bacterium]